MKKSTRFLSILMACTAFTVVGVVAGSAAYPDRQVRFVVGFPPGGSVDTIARMIGQKLSEKWGQPVVVENQLGADGSIAADVVAHAPPDGYTVAWVSNAHTITPSEYKLNYDPVKSFAPLTNVAVNPDLLIVNQTVPVNTLKELIAYAKANPNKLNYGSSGTGTSPALETMLLMKLTGMKMNSVPYKGTPLALVGLLGNEVQLMFGASSGSWPHVREGKLKGLAVSTKARVASMPDVPTVAEAADLPGFEGSSWTGALTTAGTPKEIVDKLHDDMVAIIRMPDIQKKLTDQSFLIVANSTDDFTKEIQGDIAKWSEVLKSIDIHPK